jgi:hypothetical protein
MVGTQQVGEYARLPRIVYGFAVVSILMLVKLLIKERLVIRCKYIPTHLRNFTTKLPKAHRASPNHDLFSSSSLLIM